MFLKSLELNGFKSFAQKTVLEFPKGITAIVGPNGSGKSNVIDAIRWILGEREAKNLRGAKAEDLIFAGTPKKTRSGMAQVGIYFDNTSKFFPVEFDEVSVLREINRDSNSTYFLNKSEVRAKDIVDFFARARLGTRGITIINQGSSDLFVKATPQERRAMIEEVLGLKEYQLKKTESERKLKNTLINADKARLMIEEVLPRLRMLKRQVAKYQTLDEKKTRLTELENHYFSKKLEDIKSGLLKTAQQIKFLEEQIIAKTGELKILEEELQKIESLKTESKASEEIIKKEQGLLIEKSNLQRDLGKLEAKIEMLQVAAPENKDVYQKDEMLTLLKEVREILSQTLENKDWETVSAKIQTLHQKLNAFFSKSQAQAPKKDTSGIEKERDVLLERLSSIDAGLLEIKKNQSEFTRGLEEFNQKFRAAYSTVENKKDEIRKLESQKQYSSFEKEKFSERLQLLKDEWQKTERSIQELEELKSFEENIDTNEIENNIFRLRAEILSIGEVDSGLIKEAQEVETHYNHLSGQLEDLEKATTDLKNLIEELKKEVNNKFVSAFKEINDQFNHFFKLMFGGGSAKMQIKANERLSTTNDQENEAGQGTDANTMEEEEERQQPGIDIELNLPKKRIHSLDVLSGGEKSLVSIAALFALISVSPPPFLVLDEIDAPLDEKNSARFANLIKDFAHKVQFIVVTHNRTLMEAADVLYGVTMNEDGTSKLVSMKLT